MTTLSVALATRNEEKTIGGCLESVKDLASEIEIYDEESTDKTVAKAKKYTKKIFEVSHDAMFHRTKQLAIDKCSGDWILSIDSDEQVGPDLKVEIQKVIQDQGGVAGYQIPRKNQIFGKWLESTGWYPDYQVKLFKRGKGRYPCETVHEQIKIDGPLGTLKSDLLHYHYTSVEQFVDRMNRYTSNDANYLFQKGEKVRWTDAIKLPFDEFLRRYFLWEGYRDGVHGLVLSLLQASNRLIVFAKLWQMQGFAQGKVDFNEFRMTAQKVGKDFDFWFWTKEILEEKNVFARQLKRARRKMTRI